MRMKDLVRPGKKAEYHFFLLYKMIAPRPFQQKYNAYLRDTARNFQRTITHAVLHMCCWEHFSVSVQRADCNALKCTLLKSKTGTFTISWALLGAKLSA